VEVDRLLRPGTNLVKVAVANLLIDRVLGQDPPNYTRLIAAFGDRFPYPEDWKVNPKPLSSGLIGPVRLIPGSRVNFATQMKNSLSGDHDSR
jgi:hypothetical protein